MEENKKQCIFCGKEFETARKKGCHQRLCELNPNREKMLKALRHGGSIKIAEIEKCGYKPYIIKDLGSFDIDKVNKEFEKFLMTNKIV